MVILVVFINALTAILTFLSLVGYAVVYTMYLKRATPQNIVIGGAAGAAPPVLGWVALTGTVDPHALLLFLIIFIWTPPHFCDAWRAIYALADTALYRNADCRQRFAVCIQNERAILFGRGVVAGRWLSVLRGTVDEGE